MDPKEDWAWKNWCFRTEVLEKTLESPLERKRSNQSILKEINPEYSLEVLMLKMKLQHFGHLMQRVGSLEKDPDAGKAWRQKEKRVAEDKMVRLHHWLNGHESEQTLGDVLLNNSLVKIYFSNHLTSFCPFVSMLDSSSLTLGPFFDHDSSTSLGLFSL